jgi:hypothetical protein
MNVLKTALQNVIGLFVDDEFMAVAILAVVAATAIVARFTAQNALLAGGFLLGGCVTVLVAGVRRALRARSR